MSIPEKIGNAIAALGAAAFIVVPYALPLWLFLESALPGATLLQVAFVFTILTILFVLTGVMALVIWMIGAVYIIAWLLVHIWLFLG